MNERIRQEYLKQIGIQTWLLRSNIEKPEQDLLVSEPDHEPSISVPEQNVATIDLSSEKNTEVSVISEKQDLPHVASDENPIEPAVIATENIASSAVFDKKLEASIYQCQRCNERSGRLNALIGQGDANASIFFITDAPTAEEDREGHYLTGSASSLFQAIIRTIGPGCNYYLSGIVKCFSMDEFLTSKQSISNCSEFLFQQLEIVKPRILIALGANQGCALLKQQIPFNDMRGKVHKIELNNQEYSLLVTYHPSFLIRNPLYKKQALDDLLLIKSILK